MRLDIPTLAIVTVFVTALLGALLVFAGLQNRAVRAPMTWGVAFVLCAIGTALVAVRGMVPDWLSIQFANVLVLVGMGLVWLGARQFDGRRPRPALVALAPLIWLAALAASPALCPATSTCTSPPHWAAAVTVFRVAALTVALSCSAITSAVI